MDAGFGLVGGGGGDFNERCSGDMSPDDRSTFLGFGDNTGLVFIPDVGNFVDTPVVVVVDDEEDMEDSLDNSSNLESFD
ncbi:hypothetical protein BLA29_013726 [Euroglyphus maynei]|uniref:Uncharacterized protein n=1 Tax=Euroglyphus maynei TaxID=6958 RepID=A0A1Y3B0V7_EURMA|nr:hypothetical protein BLA29_013726 [Euroglyphus maynei]